MFYCPSCIYYKKSLELLAFGLLDLFVLLFRLCQVHKDFAFVGEFLVKREELVKSEGLLELLVDLE